MVLKVLQTQKQLDLKAGKCLVCCFAPHCYTYKNHTNVDLACWYLVLKCNDGLSQVPNVMYYPRKFLDRPSTIKWNVA